MFKFILNQLGYLGGKNFDSLIMKYEFSQSMLSSIENDLIYHAKHPRMQFFEYKIRKMSTNRHLLNLKINIKKREFLRIMGIWIPYNSEFNSPWGILNQNSRLKASDTMSMTPKTWKF